jgi:hypothetical protein
MDNGCAVLVADGTTDERDNCCRLEFGLASASVWLVSGVDDDISVACSITCCGSDGILLIKYGHAQDSAGEYTLHDMT